MSPGEFGFFTRRNWAGAGGKTGRSEARVAASGKLGRGPGVAEDGALSFGLRGQRGGSGWGRFRSLPRNHPISTQADQERYYGDVYEDALR